MKKVLFIALAVVVLCLALAAPVLAGPPQGTTEAAVCPVIGGPDNGSVHPTPAIVTIPSDNPAIGSDPTMPGNIFWVP